jgi:hypothetical protein
MKDTFNTVDIEKEVPTIEVAAPVAAQKLGL